MYTTKYTIDGRLIAGYGRHQHEVPRRDGRVVTMKDSHHDGTDVYWAETWGRTGSYVFVDRENTTVRLAARIVLARGVSTINGLIDGLALDPGFAVACDLDTPDGLLLVGTDEEDDLSWAVAEGVEILWDSSDDPDGRS